MKVGGCIYVRMVVTYMEGLYLLPVQSISTADRAGMTGTKHSTAASMGESVNLVSTGLYSLTHYRLPTYCVW